MKTYFTSDWHIGHKNIIRLGERPFENEGQMSATLIQNYNEVIQDDDLVYFVGDIFWNHQLAPYYVQSLKGHKILILGNHDKGFKEKGRDKYRQFYYDAGFIHIYTCDSIPVGKYEVMINHFPYQNNDPNQRYRDHRLPDNGKWLIHGHIHQNGFVKDRQINVSVEMWDYKPVSLDTIQAIIDNTYICTPIQENILKKVGDYGNH